MVENRVKGAAGEAQDPLKKEKTYKVICGTYKARSEALQRAAEARRAGVPVSLAIKKIEYSLLYAEDMTKEEAEAAKKAIEAKKVKAEVSEQ